MPMRASLICPDTGGPVSFDVKDDAPSVLRNWKTSLAVKCPHCGCTHAVAFKEIYVDSVLTGFRDDFDRLLLGTEARPAPGATIPASDQ
jgi:hypothetical protein